MSLSKVESANFHEHMGNLFYAIAACDGEIHEFEVVQLKKLLKFHWLALDEVEDKLRAEDACLITLAFEWQVEKESNPLECFEAFKNYKEQHEEVFNDKITYLVLNTAYSIANAFEGVNEQELEMLRKLGKVFIKKILRLKEK